MNSTEAIEWLKGRNEAVLPVPYDKYPYEVKQYLKEKYKSKGSSIVMHSHRSLPFDMLCSGPKKRLDDILMHPLEVVCDKSMYSGLTCLFNDYKPLRAIYIDEEAIMFASLPRYKTEENVMFYQLVAVGLILLSGGRFLFLINNEKHSRLPNTVTMVQGHVESSYHISSMSASQYMEYELCREVKEEIRIEVRGEEMTTDELHECTTMSKVIYTTKDIVSREHVGALSIIDLRHFTDIKVTSKEDTHDVLIGTLEQIYDAGEVDLWSRIVLSAIEDGSIDLQTKFDEFEVGV